MGLFVDENGHYTGWLASFLCCFAALTEDEYPAERNKQNAKCMCCMLSIRVIFVVVMSY